MASAEIMLSGYYGADNFGDDLLQELVMESLSWHDDRSRFVRCHTLSASSVDRAERHGFVAVSMDRRFEAESLILGGGGLFFDFSTKPQRDDCRLGATGPLGSLVGSTLVKARRRAWPEIYATTRFRRGAAVGLGLGPFGRWSTRRLTTRAELAGFELLLVRDEISAEQAAAFVPDAQIRQYSDLAFSSALLRPQPELRDDRRAAVIVRDTVGAQSTGESALKQSIRALEQLGLEVVVVSLCPVDRVLMQRVAGRRSQVSYPDCDMSEVVSVLASCGYVLSARLHGLIVGVATGARTVAVGADPKLMRGVVGSDSVEKPLVVSTPSLPREPSGVERLLAGSFTATEDFLSRSRASARTSLKILRRWALYPDR